MSGPCDPFRPEPAGLYVHVPFCASLCSYCDFYRCLSSAGVPDSFVEHILLEAANYGGDPPAAVNTVYFGGGTPSLLTDGQIRALLAGFKARFEVAQGAEVTLEANPETVDAGRASAWLEAGVNRLSLGIQSFDEEEVAVLGRRCTPKRAREAVLQARQAGFANLSLDLMGGVPGQTLASLERSLRSVLSLPAMHISFYLLDLHPGTPLHERVRRGEVSLPGEDSLADIYENAHAILDRAGFEHYEVSNFARPGFRCRHNLKYWRGGEYVGLGPSAHGRFRGWMTANPCSLEAWREALNRREIPNERTEKITELRRREDEIIFGLRLCDGLSIETLEAAVEGGSLTARLERLEEGGHVVMEEGRVRLTPLGFLVSNEVIGWLLPDIERSGEGE